MRKNLSSYCHRVTPLLHGAAYVVIIVLSFPSYQTHVRLVSSRLAPQEIDTGLPPGRSLYRSVRKLNSDLRGYVRWSHLIAAFLHRFLFTQQKSHRGISEPSACSSGLSTEEQRMEMRCSSTKYLLLFLEKAPMAPSAATPVAHAVTSQWHAPHAVTRHVDSHTSPGIRITLACDQEALQIRTILVPTRAMPPATMFRSAFSVLPSHWLYDTTSSFHHSLGSVSLLVFLFNDTS